MDGALINKYNTYKTLQLELKKMEKEICNEYLKFKVSQCGIDKTLCDNCWGVIYRNQHTHLGQPICQKTTIFEQLVSDIKKNENY